MNYAKLEKSERLQRVMAVLKDRQPHSTYEIQNLAMVCAVGSSVSELRQQGYGIKCDRVNGHFEYRLLP